MTGIRSFRPYREGIAGYTALYYFRTGGAGWAEELPLNSDWQPCVRHVIPLPRLVCDIPVSLAVDGPPIVRTGFNGPYCKLERKPALSRAVLLGNHQQNGTDHAKCREDAGSSQSLTDIHTSS